MKTMIPVNFYYEREQQAIFQSEEYSFYETRPYQDKQLLVGLGT